jgi:single-strand DNA-binding protein
MAAVIGKLKNRSYDASDGTKRYVTEIICDDIQFLSPKEQNKAPDHQNFNDTDDFEPLDDEQDSQMPF